MTQLLAYQLRQAGGTRGQLMVLSKLTLLCPPLLARALPALRVHRSRHCWLPHVPYHALASALRKHGDSGRAIQALSTELMEVALWITMAALPVQQVSVEWGGESLVVRMGLCHPGLEHGADGGGPLDHDGRAARATGEADGESVRMGSCHWW